MRYYYDLHIHSCLSPCADNESTPDSIAGMGELNGLDIMALTDHNSCKNCPAFFKACERHSIVAVAGMELTTAEDIHVVCLLPSLESALAFDREVEKRRIPYKNRADIFGDQLIVNDMDEVIGREENLLINATTLSLDEVPALCEQFGGICYPAHIDKQSNSVIAVLGMFPETPKFAFAEIHNRELRDELSAAIGIPQNRLILSSDAHYLWDIKEKSDYIEFEEGAQTSDEIRERLFAYLRGAK